MATSSITVTDQGTGVEDATQTATEDALSKHFNRHVRDQRLASPSKSFAIEVQPGGESTVDAPLAPHFVHLAGQPSAYITEVAVIMGHTGIGKGNPIALFRFTVGDFSLANQFLPSAIARFDTASGDPTLEVWDSVAIPTFDAQPLLILGGHPVTTVNLSATRYMWRARDRSERIRLTGSERLGFRQHPLAGDLDDGYAIRVVWEEE